MSNFEVFPPKCEVLFLTLISATAQVKMFSINKKGRNYQKGVPLSSDLRNRVKELAQGYYAGCPEGAYRVLKRVDFFFFFFVVYTNRYINLLRGMP